MKKIKFLSLLLTVLIAFACTSCNRTQTFKVSDGEICYAKDLQKKSNVILYPGEYDKKIYEKVSTANFSDLEPKFSVKIVEINKVLNKKRYKGSYEVSLCYYVPYVKKYMEGGKSFATVVTLTEEMENYLLTNNIQSLRGVEMKDEVFTDLHETWEVHGMKILFFSFKRI